MKYAIFRINNKTLIQRRSNITTSIFSVEEMALLETLKGIEKENIRRAYIFSNSLSMLMPYTSRYPEPKMSYSILWIKELAWKLSQREIDIKLYWISAHVGIKFNEEVDRGAKEVITVGSETQLLLPYTDLFQKFKAELKKEQDWYRETSQVKKTTFLKCVLPYVLLSWTKNGKSGLMTGLCVWPNA